MNIGDLVVRKSYDKDITFKIIDIITGEGGEKIYILKGVNLRIEADSLESDLEIVTEKNLSKADMVFNKKIDESIKRVLSERNDENPIVNVFFNNKNSISKKSKGKKKREKKQEEASEDSSLNQRGSKKDSMLDSTIDQNLAFGRPGRILHVDGDPEYLQVCLKTYKELLIDAVGIAIPEKEQPERILELIKKVRPDIVVLTGHDGMVKSAGNELDIQNYRNSRYFVETVKILRDFQPSYDELVIFAGACQSCYESILDAGANFASSPSRVLIHCLDPVLVCEKIAYTNIEKFVPIGDVIKNTITGIKGIGGMKTRGKYREGFPKSVYLK